MNKLLAQEHSYSLQVEYEEGTEDLQEIEERRKDLIESQNNAIKRMIVQNESALHQMDETFLKLMESKVRTSQTESIVQAEDALEKITSKLGLYENKN